MKIEKINFLEWWKLNKTDYDAICFDVDGTLCVGETSLPGALELISLLQAENTPFIALTNDGVHSPETKAIRFHTAGFNITKESVISCGNAINHVVEDEQLENKKFFIMGEFGDPLYSDTCNIQTTKKLSELLDCDGVIVGELNYDWETTINSVINLFIIKPDAYLITPNPDSYWPIGDELAIHVGAGGVSRFILSILTEYGIKVNHIYLGKPYKAIYDYTIKHLKDEYKNLNFNDNKRILVVGDSLKSDILGANNYGCSSVLLLSGITKESHLHDSMEIKPDYIFKQI